MRTITITLYKLEELAPKVRERVISQWRDGDTFPWVNEWADSLNAFNERASGLEQMSEAEYDQLIKDCEECKLTGFTGDASFTSVLKEHRQERRGVWAAAQAACQAEYDADFDYWLSEAAICEDIEINDCEFLINGVVYIEEST